MIYSNHPSAVATNMITAVILTAVVARGILASGAGHIDHIVDPEELGNFPIPPPSHSLDNWTDWETWEASPEIAKLLPNHRSGYDYDSLVVGFGKWSFRAVAQLTQDGEKEFWKYYEELVRREERDAALCNDQGMVFLLDWEGFSLKVSTITALMKVLSKAHTTKQSSLKESLKMFASLMQLNDYRYGFFVNVNFAAETFINTARPLMGTLLDKFEMYGTRVQKWKSTVLKSIPADQLPPKYGGAKDWKPLPLNYSPDICNAEAVF